MLTYSLACHSSMKHQAQWQSVLTIDMRNLITVTLQVFHQCTRISSYKCYAGYLSSNQSLPIWVLCPNWTSEHHCPCFSAYTGKSYATWLPLLRLDSVLAFILSACGHTREKPQDNTGCIVCLNITVNLYKLLFMSCILI